MGMCVQLYNLSRINFFPFSSSHSLSPLLPFLHARYSEKLTRNKGQQLWIDNWEQVIAIKDDSVRDHKNVTYACYCTINIIKENLHFSLVFPRFNKCAMILFKQQEKKKKKTF